MVKQKLKPKILSKLERIYPERKVGSIRSSLSQLSSKKGFSLNAAAELMARKGGSTVWGLLDGKDRDYFKDKDVQIVKIRRSKESSSIKLVVFLKYDTNKPLLKAHLDEINKCYTNHCYTASFVLIRKVLEYLIVEMICHKFPEKSRENREIYLNPSNRWRLRGFSEIIENFRKKAKELDREEERLIARILDLSKKFKDGADNAAHSLYYLGKKSELLEKNPQHILELIQEFFNKY